MSNRQREVINNSRVCSVSSTTPSGSLPSVANKMTILPSIVNNSSIKTTIDEESIKSNNNNKISLNLDRLKMKSNSSGSSSGMMCPMMRNYSTESNQDLNSPTNMPPNNGNGSFSERVETPETEKIDLRHISVALMKLLYPKPSHVFDIIQNAEKLSSLFNHQNPKTCCNEISEMLASLKIEDTNNRNSSALNETSVSESTEKQTNINNNENVSWKDRITFHHIEKLTFYLAKKSGQDFDKLVTEWGIRYANQCLECDSKKLNFIGENLVEFLVNVENIQSVAYEEIRSLEDIFQKTWIPSQQDLLPIAVFVNHSETQITITYNIVKPICRFVACFLSGLLTKMAKALFNIIVKVNVEIGSDQYKIVIENYIPGLTLVNDDSFVSRYKKSLFTRPEQLLMSVQTFRRVFPFHFVCDQNLRFIQYGTGLSKVFGAQNKLNVHISNVFSIVQPNVGFFFESFRHRTNLAFILSIRDNIQNEKFRNMELKGQIIECVESKCLLFLGSPIIKGLQSLTSRGLFLSDIPIHDATRDIILIEEQSKAQESLKRRMDKLKNTIQKANEAVEIERQKNVDLLNLIFPSQVARQLWLGRPVEARQYDEVTMLFSDIVGFTAICSTASPMAVINMLNELYTQFDLFCGEVDVYKTETVGDAYCAASGLHRKTPYHAVLAAFMGLKMINAVKNFNPKDIDVDKIQMRIGLHSGSCLAGIVGVKMPRYCLFGAHVTLANKFESNSEAQRINISPTTLKLLKKFDKFYFTPRDPSCLPKECPANMERVSTFLDDYQHPRMDRSIPQAIHIVRALEEIFKDKT